jgi:hypothetical protein
MYEYVYTNLFNIYEIIKFIHKLYIKYKDRIKFKSFENCGKGFDIINILQLKIESPPILLTKTIIKDNKIYLLPQKIITMCGLWSFINESEYLYYDINFTKELIDKLSLIYLFPSSFSEELGKLETMFVISKFNNINFNIGNIIKMNINTINKVYKFEDIFNKIEYLFNEIPFGPNIIEYLFDNFIKKYNTFNIIDDNTGYFKSYNKYKNKFIDQLKLDFEKRGIFYKKSRILSQLFYYNYYDYIL